VNQSICEWLFAGILLFLLSFSCGCHDGGPEISRVDGIIRLNGKPAPGMMVRFLPDPQQGNDVAIDASGVSDEQGRYVLEYSYQGQEGEGAPVGWHRVLVSDATLPYTPQGRTPPPSRVPFEYASPATTPLAVEVKPGEQTIDLEVKR
jgi:hypothetical protein